MTAILIFVAYMPVMALYGLWMFSVTFDCDLVLRSCAGAAIELPQWTATIPAMARQWVQTFLQPLSICLAAVTVVLAMRTATGTPGRIRAAVGPAVIIAIAPKLFLTSAFLLPVGARCRADQADPACISDAPTIVTAIVFIGAADMAMSGMAAALCALAALGVFTLIRRSRSAAA